MQFTMDRENAHFAEESWKTLKQCKVISALSRWRDFVKVIDEDDLLGLISDVQRSTQRYGLARYGVQAWSCELGS